MERFLTAGFLIFMVGIGFIAYKALKHAVIINFIKRL
tara:strand:- start:1126 stop:1236 length:111 start_codon:yes stop_codon:yes gene_type:complete